MIMGVFPSPIPRTSILAVGLILGAGCVPPEATIPSSAPAATWLVEQSVKPLPLAGPLASPEAEISGMAWYGETLVILPQYPERFAEGEVPQIFGLPKSSIVEVLEGQSEELEPIPILFIAPDFRAEIAGYQGFEAIGFADDRAFLTIEADTGTETTGYLVSGQVVGDLQQIQIETELIVQIPSQAGLGNMAEESLVVTDGALLTFHEVNGEALNPNPVAHRFSFDLEPLGTVPFPNLEYRVTDATAMDEAGRFWVMNYFWEGDLNLKPEADPLVQRYGTGPTHAGQETVERIVALQYDGNQITLIEEPPRLLTLAKEGRNWEAIVRLDDRGFLVMTDTFPNTILGFVPGQFSQE
jgi:hypothetical protein